MPPHGGVGAYIQACVPPERAAARAAHNSHSPSALTHSTTGPAAHTMGLYSCIAGFSLFGLAARLGQLGIQKRNLFESESAPPAAVRGAR